MEPIDLITGRRRHLERLANRSGARGEATALLTQPDWYPRPRGPELKTLLAALAADGIMIRPTSFDAIAAPRPLSFDDPSLLRGQLQQSTFIEIKTANQPRVKPGFAGFFFALTEAEIIAAEQLGPRHRVVLFNNLTGEMLSTSVPEILARSKSTNWQVSVQL